MTRENREPAEKIVIYPAIRDQEKKVWYQKGVTSHFSLIDLLVERTMLTYQDIKERGFVKENGEWIPYKDYEENPDLYQRYTPSSRR